MPIGGGLALIALGAVLRWAVTARTSGLDLPTVGTILMVVGVIGLAITLSVWASRRRTAVVREADPYLPARPVAPVRRTYVDPDELDEI